jgi:rhamnulokinase
MEGDDNLWLSSGTWSIMGIETNTAVTNSEALNAGFSNELGANRSVRFLKNISGLWLLQECKRQWELDGKSLDFSTMVKLAEEAEPFSAFIDPDDALFSHPGDMPAKIAAWCKKTGQKVPHDTGTILRVATDSLALKYRVAYEAACKLSGKKFKTLHTGGGGIQNQMLSQATANALGIEVIAGPVEATSCGNVIIQMLATGAIDSLAAGRELIRQSFDFKSYKPQDTDAWDTAFARFIALIS